MTAAAAIGPRLRWSSFRTRYTALGGLAAATEKLKIGSLVYDVD